MKKTILLAGCLLLAATASAEGLADGKAIPLFPQGYTQYAKDLKVGADGTIWYVVDHPNLHEAQDEYDTEHVVYEFRAQCYGRDGVAKFGDEGLLVSDYSNISYTTVNDYLFVDRDGNAVIMVNDCRNSSSIGRSYSIYKLSTDGQHLWDEEGVNLEGETSYDTVSYMNCIQLEDGSYVLAWSGMNYRDSYLTITKMARLKADGTLVWVKQLGTDASPVTLPMLANAGSNEYIVTYLQNGVVYCNKFDFGGDAVWKSPTRVYRGGFNSNTPTHTILHSRPTPDGGVLVYWYDDRNYTGAESAYISHVTNDGKLAFAGASDEGDVKVGYISELRNISIQAAPCADGSGFVAFWRKVSLNNWVGLQAQRITPEGELLWGDEGYEVAPLRVAEKDYAYINVSPATGSDMGIFWQGYDAWIDQQSYCMRLDEDANSVWADPVWQFTPNGVGSQDLTIIRVDGDEPYWLAWWYEHDAETGSYGGTQLFMRLPFDHATSGIDQVALAPEQPADAQGDLYDLMGRRVASPAAHGIYIRNGKKIIL